MLVMMQYRNRQEAGKKLAAALAQHKGEGAVILALPRGGVVLAAEVAKSLGAPLGLILVRKIGHPAYAEYAIGAIAEEEAPVYNTSEVASTDKQWLKQAELRAREMITQRRETYYGDDFEPPDVSGKIVIIVDDGIATGLTMRAAVQAIRNQHPRQVIVAVPVASEDSVEVLQQSVDQVIVLSDPKQFLGAVGAHYQEFEQVDDNRVTLLIREVSHEIQHATRQEVL